MGATEEIERRKRQMCLRFQVSGCDRDPNEG